MICCFVFLHHFPWNHFCFIAAGIADETVVEAVETCCVETGGDLELPLFLLLEDPFSEEAVAAVVLEAADEDSDLPETWGRGKFDLQLLEEAGE